MNFYQEVLLKNVDEKIENNSLYVLKEEESLLYSEFIDMLNLSDEAALYMESAMYMESVASTIGNFFKKIFTMIFKVVSNIVRTITKKSYGGGSSSGSGRKYKYVETEVTKEIDEKIGEESLVTEADVNAIIPVEEKKEKKAEETPNKESLITRIKAKIKSFGDDVRKIIAFLKELFGNLWSGAKEILKKIIDKIKKNKKIPKDIEVVEGESIMVELKKDSDFIKNTIEEHDIIMGECEEILKQLESSDKEPSEEKIATLEKKCLALEDKSTKYVNVIKSSKKSGSTDEKKDTNTTSKTKEESSGKKTDVMISSDRSSEDKELIDAIVFGRMSKFEKKVSIEAALYDEFENTSDKPKYEVAIRQQDIKVVVDDMQSLIPKINKMDERAIALVKIIGDNFKQGTASKKKSASRITKLILAIGKILRIILGFILGFNRIMIAIDDKINTFKAWVMKLITKIVFDLAITFIILTSSKNIDDEYSGDKTYHSNKSKAPKIDYATTIVH